MDWTNLGLDLIVTTDLRFLHFILKTKTGKKQYKILVLAPAGKPILTSLAYLNLNLDLLGFTKWHDFFFFLSLSNESHKRNKN